MWGTCKDIMAAVAAALCRAPVRRSAPLAFLLLVIIVAPARADLIAARAFVEDPSGRMSLEDVQRQQATPFDLILSRGYSRSIYWVRLTIDPARDGENLRPDRRIVLMTRPTYIDSIEVHDPLEQRIKRTGDLYPVAGDDFVGLSLDVTLRAGVAPRDIWLRVETTSAYLLLVEASSDVRAQQTIVSHAVAAGIYLGLILLFFVRALYNWVATRERLMLAFLVRQIASFVYYISVLGYLRCLAPPSLPPWFVDVFTNVSVISYTFASVWFDFLFLGDMRAPRGSLLLLRGSLVFAPICLGLLAAGDTRAAMATNMGVILVEPMITLAAAVMTKAWHAPVELDRPPFPKWSLVALFATIAPTVGMAALTSFGLLPAVRLDAFAPLLHTVLSGFFVLMMLEARVQRLGQRQLAAEKRLLLSNAEMQKEREYRLEQSKLFTMLAHELRTPLSGIQMSTMVLGPPQVAQRIDGAVRDMSDIIDRCLYSSRIEEGAIDLQIEPISMTDLLATVRDMSPSADRIAIEAPTDSTVETDPLILRTILGNLVDNARKYSPPATPIRIVLDQGVAGVRVIVANRLRPGDGPDPARVFEKYYRSPQARRQSGSGLGLYIVRHLASLISGRVTYVTGQEEVRFELWLPV